MSDRITVVGNIATTPERRRTASGVTVVSFRLATNHRRRDATGQWVDSATNWYTVSGYRGLAEHALSSFLKGQRVIVTGSLRVRDWESNGKNGREAEIDADAFGHDLLWGTTVFARDQAGNGTADQNGHGHQSGIDGYPQGNNGHHPNDNGQYHNGNGQYPSEDGPYRNGNGRDQNGSHPHQTTASVSARGPEAGFSPSAREPSARTEAADWGAPREPVDSGIPF